MLMYKIRKITEFLNDQWDFWLPFFKLLKNRYSSCTTPSAFVPVSDFFHTVTHTELIHIIVCDGDFLTFQSKRKNKLVHIPFFKLVADAVAMCIEMLDFTVIKEHR